MGLYNEKRGVSPLEIEEEELNGLEEFMVTHYHNPPNSFALKVTSFVPGMGAVAGQIQFSVSRGLLPALVQYYRENTARTRAQQKKE